MPTADMLIPSVKPWYLHVYGWFDDSSKWIIFAFGIVIVGFGVYVTVWGSGILEPTSDKDS